MERRSWLWRKKGGKAEKSFDSHLDLAFSIQGYEEPPSKIAVEQEAQQTHIEDTQLMKAISLRLEAEENVKMLTEKLSAAIEDMRTKEDLVKKQSNVAQEAVSGWEKAEAEALSLKQELEASVKEKYIVEDRAMRLDGALKECMRQVRQAKDEHEHKIQDLIIQKTREVEKIKAELDAKQVELRRRLMESNAENSAMSKSLQERAKTIVEANEAKARAETEVKVLQVRLDEMGKEISALKFELHVLNKELQIRNEEREVSKKAADAAHKAHLENTKKIAKLESECQRLRNLVRKRLPGPAAMAQMRIEVEALGIDIAGDGKRRRPLISKGITSTYPTDADKQQSRDATKVIEMLTERMLSMDEETKLLKETLAKRNEELQASRQLCARTANKLSLAEDQLETVQGTPRGSKNLDSQTEPSVASRSEDNAGGIDDEVHCAESWASALITELSHFRKGKAPHARRHSTESCNFDAIEESVEHCFTVQSDTNVSKIQQMETGSLAPAAGELGTIKALASKEAELQVANLMCKDVSGKLSVLEEQLRSLFSDKNADISTVTTQVQELMLQGLADARQKVSKLDRVLDEMRIAVATLDDTDTEDNSHKAAGIPEDCSVDPTVALVRTIVIDRNAQDTISGATLTFVLCKLVSLIEMKRNSLPSVQDSTSQGAKEGDSLGQQPVDQLPEQTRQIEKEIQCLAIVKQHCLQGKASVLEFLIRLGVVLCGLWNLDSSDLESLQMEEQKRSGEETPGDGTRGIDLRFELGGKALNANADSQPIQIPSISDDEREAFTRAKAELEEQLGATDGELQSVRSELTETRKLVSDLESRITNLLSAEKKLADREAERAELQDRYDKAQTEVNKLQGSVASLTSELEVQRTQCGELEQRLQKNVEQNQANNYRGLADEDDARSRKEREMAVAKQKLAECQRTIVVLGKQLTALSSPPNHSPARSFDSASVEPANDGMQLHWAGEPFPATPTMDEFQNHDAFRGHQYHRRKQAVSAPHYRARNDRLRWSDPSRGCYYTTSGGPLHAPPQYAYQFLPDPASVTPAHANGRHPSPPTTDYSHGSAVAAYSAPHSAKSSPTPSPPRDRDRRSRERRKSASAVRTSLTEAMNRAADDGSGVSEELVTQRRPGTSSGFGRLFSRSKNRH